MIQKRDGLINQISGVVDSDTDGLGRLLTTAPDYSTNYSLPGTLTPNSNSNLATSVSYASSWAVTSVAAPNGATSTTTYDAFGRPASSKSADGFVTTYTYTYNPNTQTATISNPPENPGGTQWKRTTLDGFGRTIRVETGHDSVTISTVDTQYGPCACSPLGKVSAVSQPYAPGDTPVWTTTTHDGIGRTLAITAPDGSVTRYSYAGTSTTLTDPAGKWKTQTQDALGNLVQVTEPNPAGGSNFVTSYTYDARNHLTGVTMTRPEGTQTRTFTYSGPDLVSTTNPENGTVTYTYDAAHEVNSRTDALGQQTQYSYDAYGRLTEVRHYLASGVEDPNQRWDLSTTSAQAIQVQNQLRWIQQAVKDDATCDSWLQNNQTDIDFMLGQRAGNTTMRVGVGNFSQPGVNAVAGTGGTNLTPGSMDITVNRNGAFFTSNVSTGYGVNISSGTFEAQIFLLLH